MEQGPLGFVLAAGFFTAAEVSKSGLSSKWFRPMADDRQEQESITHEDVQVLAAEYESLTTIHESMIFLEQVSGEIVVGEIDPSDLPATAAALRSEIALLWLQCGYKEL
jgi:hypothetical protein